MANKCNEIFDIENEVKIHTDDRKGKKVTILKNESANNKKKINLPIENFNLSEEFSIHPKRSLSINDYSIDLGPRYEFSSILDNPIIASSLRDSEKLLSGSTFQLAVRAAEKFATSEAVQLAAKIAENFADNEAIQLAVRAAEKFATSEAVQLAAKIAENFADNEAVQLAAKAAERVITELNGDYIQYCNEWNAKIFPSIENSWNQIGAFKSFNPDLFKFEDGLEVYYDKLYKELPIDVSIRVDLPKPKEEHSPRIVLEHRNGSIELVSDKLQSESIPKLFKRIETSDVANFINHLARYPFLGYAHQVGKDIYDELKEKISKHSIPLEADKVLFRARSLKREVQDYTYLQMFSPSEDKTSISRFSMYGLNHLYLAEDEETAILEARQESQDCCVVELKPKSSFRLLDLGQCASSIYSQCQYERSDGSTFPREYLIPNYISQCCCHIRDHQKIEIDGIVYQSTKKKDSFSYVLFDKFRDSFSPIDSTVRRKNFND